VNGLTLQVFRWEIIYFSGGKWKMPINLQAVVMLLQFESTKNMIVDVNLKLKIDQER
jgi:hypothetical protein